MQLDLLDRPGRCSGRGPHDSKVREGWGGRRRPQAEAHRPRLRRAARPARAAWTALRLLANVADSILVIFRFGATMERPRRSSAASYGVSSTTIAKFRSTDVVRPPSLAQRSARKDQRNLAALIMIVAHARAREAGRRDAARPARAAWTALRLLANVADSILVIFRFGATMERPRRASAASYGGSSTTIAKFRSTDVVRPPSLAQRSARKDQRNLAALIMIVALTRARAREAGGRGRRGQPRPPRAP